MNAESNVAGAPRPSRWTAGRVVLVVLGSIAVLLGAALLAGGGALLWADQTQRDDDGFLSTPTELFSSSSYAIVSEPIDLVEADAGDWLWEDVLGDVRVRASGGGLKDLRPIWETGSAALAGGCFQKERIRSVGWPVRNRPACAFLPSGAVAFI